MKHLDQWQVNELAAVAKTTAALGGRPTFVHRLNWFEGYAILVRRKLVTWGKWRKGTLGPRFASVRLTRKGWRVLQKEKHRVSADAA